MDNEFIERKINEINSKNNSEEEKLREINNLKKGNINTYTIGERGVYFIIFTKIFVAFFILSSIFLILNLYLLFMGCCFVFSIGFLCYYVYSKVKKRNHRYENSCCEKFIKTEASKYQQIYEKVYEKLNNNYNYEKKRKSVYIRTVISIIHIIALLSIIPFCADWELSENISLMITAYLMIMSFAFPLTIYTKRKECVSIYKDEVVSDFINNINNNIDYINIFDNKNKDEEQIKTKNLIYDYVYSGFGFLNATKANIYDYMEGYINNSYVEMGDIYAYKVPRGRYSYIESCFGGFFIVINSNTLFPESQIRLKTLRFVKKEYLVDIDNLNFNKYFKVFAEDKEKVKEYLTPQLIDFLAEFREKYKIDFEISFKDKIYVRFYTKYIFNPTIFSSNAQKYSAYEYYVITKFAEELVEKLNIV